MSEQADIVAEATDYLRTMAPHQSERYTADLIARLALGVRELRAAIRRLAEQDATLSVCDGAVTVTMDATLTDAEREVLGLLRQQCQKRHWDDWADVVGGLLDRIG